MPIKHTEMGDVQLIEVSGNIENHEAEDLETKLSDLRNEKKYKVVLDLSGVEHICSAALGLLVTTKRELERQGGDLKLVITTDYLTQLFEITMLDRVFDIFRNSNDAVSDFA